MIFIRHLIPALITLVLIAPPTTMAQVFPVQVSVGITPPYTPYLSDYTGGYQNFVVHITLKDAAVANYACKLRLVIEGTGIAIQTREDYGFKPIFLEGGGLLTLFGEDLREYFHPDALLFSGIPSSDNGGRVRLPEGLYRFGVEVLDYYRGTVVSNRGIAAAWIVLNDPPVLNLPLNQATVPLQDPPNIAFSWTPRHTGSPNAAFSTEYTFRLVEIWPESRNPADAFLTQPPIYETTTRANQLLYGPTAPSLLPGKRYAWQVEAREQDGKDLFKNRGRSEVFVFQYGEALPIPSDLRMRWAKPTTLAIQWNRVKTDGDVRYRLQYRPARRSENREWYETWTRYTDKTLYHLQSNTEYEMRIRSENAVQESPYSATQVFKTLREEPAGFICRDNIEPPPLPDDTAPVFSLAINDTIRAGGYDVVVRDVLRDGTQYYGSGFAIVPWLNSAKVSVTFEKIRVNEQFFLTSGTIHSVWNSTSTWLIETQKPVEPGRAPEVGELDITIVDADTLVAIKGAAIAAVTKSEDGYIIVTTTDGQKQRIAPGEKVAITDETGNGYVIDEKGNVAKTTASEATAAAHRGERQYRTAVIFSQGRGRFGFDEKKYDHLAHYYQQLDDGTYVAWKAISSSSPDELEAIAEVDGANPELTFESGGTPLTGIVLQGNRYTLRVQGKAGGIEEELLALYSNGDSLPRLVAGKINIVTYDPIHYKLEVIPVNGAVLPGGLEAARIAQHLNEVYSQAVVTWEVSVRERLEVPLGETFDDGDAGLFSNYTADMKKVLNAFGRLEDDTWYLFVLETPRNPSTLGYMPRNKSAGFVFATTHEGNVSSFLKTIAHELGHGAFNLRHTFTEHALPVGATDNLMDYGEGTALFKYQWDDIHTPQGVRWFEGGEGSMLNDSEGTPPWWDQLPAFRKAGEILAKHLEDTRVYETVAMNCDNSRCLVTADLKIDDFIYSMDVTLNSNMSADELIHTLVFEYRVDLWDAFNIKAENIWDELYNWWRKQNDNLAQQTGWQVSTLNFLADVLTAPTFVPAVEGWITGKHWRDGHKLSGWEQALSALDFLVAEEMAKACITSMIVKASGKAINLLALKGSTRHLIRNAIQKGLSIDVWSSEEILILGAGKKVIGKINNDVLTIPYSKYGGDIICDPNKCTTVIGRFNDLVHGGGIKVIKEDKLYEYGENIGGINILDDPNWNMLVNEKWLREAVERGDIIRVVSDPTARVNIWVDGFVGGTKTPFGREIELLENLGYRFDAATFQFVK